MNIKKVLAAVFVTAIMSATAITTALSASAAYDHSYKSGYYYTDTANAYGTSTAVISMSSFQRDSTVRSSVANLTSSSMYIEAAVTVYSKSSGKELKSGVSSGTYTQYYGTTAQCSDYRSTSTNVYYEHTGVIMGDVKVSSSKISSIIKTVG